MGRCEEREGIFFVTHAITWQMGSISRPAPMPPGSAHLHGHQHGQLYCVVWQGEAPALLSVAADGGSTNSPTLVTLGPALPPPRVGEEEGHHFLSHSTLWQRKGGTRSPTHLRSTELITCEVNGVSYTALPLLGTRLNLPSAAVVRDRVSSPTLVTLGSAFLAIIGDKRQGGYLSPKPLHDRRWG